MLQTVWSIFNAQSCNARHTQPLKTGEFRHQAEQARSPRPGLEPRQALSILHQACITPVVQDSVPSTATIVAHRKTTPLFGLGLMEAIPDDTIIANVHKTPVDGVKGKAAMVTDPIHPNEGSRVGRFGWKCQQASVDAFSGDAYANEMGIANRVFPLDFAPHITVGQSVLETVNKANGFPKPAGLNQDPPEDPTKPFNPVNNKDDVERFADFMRTLAPPPVLPLSNQAFKGQQLFASVNCVACHKPSMSTVRSSSIGSLNFKNVPLYSDLLLHDMGSLGDGSRRPPRGLTRCGPHPSGVCGHVLHTCMTAGPPPS